MKKLFALSLIYLMALSTMAQNSVWVDLGLSSGTLWKRQNESRYYTYEEALSHFGNKLPEIDHFVELQSECTWIWIYNYGYKVIGPNGNFITLPAEGYRSCVGGMANLIGTGGCYWTSSPCESDYAWTLYFYSRGVGIDFSNRCYGRSVRLVQ